MEALEGEKKERMGSLHAAMVAMGGDDDSDEPDDNEDEGEPVTDAAPDA